MIIPLKSSPEEIARAVTSCAGVLLPGSKADVDPQKFNAKKHPETAPADQLRDAADELLLQDAYNLSKPVFGICYGLQSLNVWRTGTLVQHIESKVNHSAGSKVEIAHSVVVAADSLLAREMHNGQAETAVPVNSSHHQSAEVVGDGLRAVARCPEDGVIEAIEGTAPEHYVLAVQWHPERTFEQDPVSGQLVPRVRTSGPAVDGSAQVTRHWLVLAHVAYCSVSYLPWRKKALFCRWKTA